MNNAKIMSWGILLLRLVVGGVFLYHGIMKLTGGPGMADFVGGAAHQLGFTLLSVNTWFQIATWAEILGGSFLILGLFVPVAVFFLACVMIFALNMKGWSFEKGELDYTLLGALISLALMGGGKWSLDALIFKKKDNKPAQ